MSDSQREQIRSNAKYLRQVRSLDPEELSRYVEGEPHPAVVRQVLREDALNLGLIERNDGTFGPVPDEPVEVDFRCVESFPTEYERRLEDVLAEAYGPNWFEGETGGHLWRTIRRLKEDYFRQNSVEYDYDAALGYAIYHLPDYYAAIQYVLAEIAERGLLDHDLRVLDVGAGDGGPALGLHDFLPDDTLIEYHAVEPSNGARVLEESLDWTGRNFHWSIHRKTAEAFEPERPYDVLLFANVLSELDDPVAVVERYLHQLAHDGSFVALAPADLNTATQIREVERAFSPEYTVYSPTLRLWPGYEPSDRGWSFDVRPDLAVPSFQRRLDDGSGEFVNVDVQYAYFVLRADGERRREFHPDEHSVAKMADADDHVTKRIDLAGVKLSHDLSEDGEHPVFKVGDGSERVGHFAVAVSRTSLNEALVRADYGDVLLFENVLVLWNDDEEAYNLVVDEEAVVDRVA
jgi:SAM-dependent methyltransferase